MRFGIAASILLDFSGRGNGETEGERPKDRVMMKEMNGILWELQGTAEKFRDIILVY